MARILTAIAASVAKSVVKPITSIAHAMQKLSVGATAVQLGHRKRRDEIGRMIEAIEIFRHNALEIQAMQLSPRQAEEQRALKRREEMGSLTAEFEGSVKQIAAQLVEAVTAVRNNAEAMAKAAEDTKTKSSSTVDAVVNTRENEETVAQAARGAVANHRRTGPAHQRRLQAHQRHCRAIRKRQRRFGQARRLGGADPADHRPHPGHCAPDKPAGAERDDRGRAGGNGGERLRGRCRGSKNARSAERASDG